MGAFDAFPVAKPAPAQPAAADPWAAFPKAPLRPGPPTLENAAAPPAEPGPTLANAAALPKQEPNPWVDLPMSLGSGIVRGAVEFGMSPVSAGRLAESGLTMAFDSGEDLIRQIMGQPAYTDEERTARQQFRDSQPTLSNFLYDAQDSIRGVMDQTLYAPQSKAGEYVELGGEFLNPGGWPSRATRMAPTLARQGTQYIGDLVRNVMVPAGVAQAVGDIPGIEGTAYEPWAEAAGALVGGSAGAVAKSAVAAENVLRRAVGNPDNINWNRAIALQNNGQGIHLMGPESITQAQDGGTALADVMRVVEGSIEGNQRLSPHFAARPAQVEAAVNRSLDQIAPQSPQPYSLGPQASDAATQAIRDVEAQRTAQVEPIYQAAATDQVPAAQVQALLDEIGRASAADQTGVISGPLNELRDILTATPAQAGTPASRTPVLSPDGRLIRYIDNPSVPPTPAVPITDIENLDRARKFLRDRMDLPQIGVDATTKGQNAVVTSFLDRLNGLMERSSPTFLQGKEQFAQLSDTLVNPVARGPLGAVADAGTTKAAGDALLPKNPLTGSEGEISDAVTRLVMQDADTTRGLVRQNLSDRFNAAQTETQGGSVQAAGAKFHRDVAGNPQRAATLYAVLDALGTPAQADMPELLDVLQATGRRRPIGSATEFNRSINTDLGNASPSMRALDLVKSLGTTWFTNVKDASRRAAMRGSLSDLADMFADPQSVELIRAAIARGARPNLAEVPFRSGTQTLPGLTQEDR